MSRHTGRISSFSRSPTGAAMPDVVINGSGFDARQDGGMSTFDESVRSQSTQSSAPYLHVNNMTTPSQDVAIRSPTRCPCQRCLVVGLTILVMILLSGLTATTTLLITNHELSIGETAALAAKATGATTDVTAFPNPTATTTTTSTTTTYNSGTATPNITKTYSTTTATSPPATSSSSTTTTPLPTTTAPLSTSTNRPSTVTTSTSTVTTTTTTSKTTTTTPESIGGTAALASTTIGATTDVTAFPNPTATTTTTKNTTTTYTSGTATPNITKTYPTTTTTSPPATSSSSTTTTLLPTTTAPLSTSTNRPSTVTTSTSTVTTTTTTSKTTTTTPGCSASRKCHYCTSRNARCPVYGTMAGTDPNLVISCPCGTACYSEVRYDDANTVYRGCWRDFPIWLPESSSDLSCREIDRHFLCFCHGDRCNTQNMTSNIP